MTRKHDLFDMNNAVLFVVVLFFLLFANVVPTSCVYLIEYDSRWQMFSMTMIPTLQLFDFVYVKNVTGQTEVHASYDNGDIILFQSPQDPDGFVLHRAVEKFQQDGSWYFKTKGDYNVAIDVWNITEDLVIGKVVALSRILPVGSYSVTIFSNSAFDSFHFNSTMNVLEFTVTALLTQSAPNSFLNVTVPNELVTGELDVLVNGSSVHFGHSTNATHHFILFDREGTDYIINIVLPEFPSLIILRLFMVAILIVAISYRRKHSVRKLSAI